MVVFLDVPFCDNHLVKDKIFLRVQMCVGIIPKEFRNKNITTGNEIIVMAPTRPGMGVGTREEMDAKTRRAAEGNEEGLK